MYSNAAAVYRADLSGYVFESQDWEKNLIGTQVMPIVDVTDEVGQYPIFKKSTGGLLKRDVKARAPYGPVARGTTKFEQDTYKAQEWSYEQAIDDTVAKSVSKFFDAELIATRIARRKLLMDHEVRVAAQIFNSSNFTSTNSSVAYTAANLATFDIGLDIDEAKDRLTSIGEGFNTLVIPYQVATRARASTKLQQRARGAGVSGDAILNLDANALADVFGVDRVLIAKGVIDSAPEGASFVSSLIWSSANIWLGKVTEAGTPAAMLNGGAGYTLNWSKFGPAVGVSTYRDETIKSDIVRAEHYTAEKVVNAAAGQLIATQYS